MTHDLRHALGAFRHHAWFSPVLVLTLGLGIGVATTLFAIVSGAISTDILQLTARAVVSAADRLT